MVFETMLTEAAVLVALATGFAVAGGLLALRVGLPVQLGYLGAGLVIGLLIPGQDERREALGLAASVAVAGVLFLLALRSPLHGLADKPWLVVAAVGQVVGLALVGAWLGGRLGVDPRDGILIGAATATASTAFGAVIAGVRRGRTVRLVATCSLVQAAVALAIPWLAAPGAPEGGVGPPLALVGLLGGWVVPSLHRGRADLRRAAGIRDALVAVFLVGLGSLVDPAAIGPEAGLLVPIVAAALVLKLASSTIVTRGTGLRGVGAILVGAALVPLGEVAFVVAHEGLLRGLLDASQHQLIIAATAGSVVAMAFAVPVRARSGPRSPAPAGTVARRVAG